jgi:hypothetical protein
MFAAAMDRDNIGVSTVAVLVWPRLERAIPLWVDRLYGRCSFFNTAAATGAHLLQRMRREALGH